MRPGQARFVTACQQLLALGAVLAVLTPAASVISLDVVSGDPGTHAGRTGSSARPASGSRRRRSSRRQVVDPVVAEYAAHRPRRASRGADDRLTARTKAAAAPGHAPSWSASPSR